MNLIRRGFTLIELLTVMAISAILLGIIIFPLYQSFNLTRQAQAFSDAQDRARILSERIGREIGNAYSVRGGAIAATMLNGSPASVQPSAVIVRVPNSTGGVVEIPMPYTKLDLVRPAEGDQSEIGARAFTNPVTGMVDPTIQSPKGQVVLPVAPGFSMTRYFIALRNPLAPYNNPYDGLLMGKNSNQDNLYLLYRADVQPYVLRAGINGDATLRYRPNLDLFESDSATDTQIEYTITGADTSLGDFDPGRPGVQAPGMDDPRFATMDLNPDGSVMQNEHNARVLHWITGQKASWETNPDAARFAHAAVVQTEISRYDMIVPEYDLRTRAVKMVSSDVTPAPYPSLLPLIQFRPEKMVNEAAVGRSTVRQGDESASAGASAPDVFLTRYGQWGAAIIRAYPRNWDPTGVNGSPNYEIGVSSNAATITDPTSHFATYAYAPSSGPDISSSLPPFQQFNISQYTRLAAGMVAPGRFPFTGATTLANQEAIAATGPGMLSIGSANLRRLFTPYSFDAARGRIISSFNISEVGGLTPTGYVAPFADPDNLPYISTALTAAFTPSTDPTVATGVFSDPQFSSINEKFNKVYHDYTELLPDNVHRFIDLRSLRNSDGTRSPLFPDYDPGQVTNFVNPNSSGSGYRNRVQITPGSEVVTGPDQLPGPHYGSPIQYTRISTGQPAPNQYKINYADQNEPEDASGAAYERAFGLTEGTNPGQLPVGTALNFRPNVYDPTNFISAVLQPRNKVGYIQLNSDPNVALPYAGGALNVNTASFSGFRISYRFQFTGTTRSGTQTRTETFAVDYDSRQLISVLLTIRNYPQSAAPNPQSVTLKSTAKVRNYTR